MNGRQPFLGRVSRKIRVDLGGDIRARTIESRELRVQGPSVERQAERRARRGASGAAGTERLLDGIDARWHVEQLCHLGAIEYSH